MQKKKPRFEILVCTLTEKVNLQVKCTSQITSTDLLLLPTHVPNKVDSALTAPKILGNACQAIGETRPRTTDHEEEVQNQHYPNKNITY